MMHSKNIRKWTFILLSLFLISCKTHDENKKYSVKQSAAENNKQSDSQFQGEFSSTVETDETTSGTGSITYHFNIKGYTAVLTTTTYHEPIRCNGNYKTVENNGILELYYSGNEENCKSKNANFKIKQENNKYYIQGLGGEATFNEWIELSKLKSEKK
jgi:hypothetical protein